MDPTTTPETRLRSTVGMVIVLLAAAVGFLHGASAWKRDLEAARAETTAASAGREAGAGAGASASTGAKGAPAGTGTSATASPAPPPPRPVRDLTEEGLAEAKAALRQGDEAMKQARYADARALYERAAKGLEGNTSVVALPLARLAQVGTARASVLQALEKSAPPNDFASGEKLTKLTLRGEGGAPGSEYVCRVLDFTPGKNVTFRLSSGVELTLPAGELAKTIEPCPKEEWRRRCVASLAERKERADPESAFEIFRVAVFALENGLRAEAHPLLEQALAKDRAGRLCEYVCDEKERPSALMVQLARGGSADELARAEGGGRPDPVTGRSGATSVSGGTSGATAEGRDVGGPVVILPEAKLAAHPGWREASRRLAEAIGHYQKSFRGSAQAEKELKLALEGLNDVATRLEALRAEFPESPALDAKIVEVNLARVDCRKRATLG